MATANFNINAEDGWIEVVGVGSDFVRISSNTSRHAIFVTDGTTTPAASVIGYKIICDEFWCNTTNPNKYYVRVASNVPQETLVDVFYIATAP